MLHLAYVFLPVGLLFAGLAAILPSVPPAAGLHAFGVGAIGCMTLAVMMRATLGHTGRELRAGVDGCSIFAAVLLAGVLRVCAAFHPAQEILLYLSAAAWSAGFLGYVALFGGMLLRSKVRVGEDEGRDLLVRMVTGKRS